jgi:hypothetical protein
LRFSRKYLHANGRTRLIALASTQKAGRSSQKSSEPAPDVAGSIDSLSPETLP